MTMATYILMLYGNEIAVCSSSFGAVNMKPGVQACENSATFEVES